MLLNSPCSFLITKYVLVSWSIVVASNITYIVLKTVNDYCAEVIILIRPSQQKNYESETCLIIYSPYILKTKSRETHVPRIVETLRDLIVRCGFKKSSIMLLQ